MRNGHAMVLWMHQVGGLSYLCSCVWAALLDTRPDLAVLNLLNTVPGLFQQSLQEWNG